MISCNLSPIYAVKQLIFVIRECLGRNIINAMTDKL
jgi:hypothetical protein